MKPTSVIALRTGLLAAVLAFPSAYAQTPASKDKLVNRDELRACMNSESELTTRRQALDARADQNREEGTAVRAALKDLVDEKKRLDADPNEVRTARFERQVKAHNAKVKAVEEKVEALRVDLDTFNKALLAYNDQCGGISFRVEDKEAILKERAGKAN